MLEERKKYEEIISERKKVDEEIQVLKENEFVKRYIELCKKSNELKLKYSGTYRQLKLMEYSMCRHLWVSSRFENDRVEGRLYNYFGYIKCGLDQSIFSKIECSGDDTLSYDEQIMYTFFKTDNYHRGYHMGLFCDLELGTAIYRKIRENNPNISDREAIKYFESALNNIRNIEVNEDRKKSRARRLSLNCNFNKWNSKDIII